MPEFVEIIITARDLASNTFEKAAAKIAASTAAMKAETTGAGSGFEKMAQQADKMGPSLTQLDSGLIVVTHHTKEAGSAAESLAASTAKAGSSAREATTHHTSLAGSLARLISNARTYASVLSQVLRLHVSNSGAMRAFSGATSAFQGAVSRAAIAVGLMDTRLLRMFGRLAVGTAGLAAAGAAVLAFDAILGAASGVTVAFAGALSQMAGVALAAPAAFGALGGAVAAFVGIIKPATTDILSYIQAQEKATGQGGGGGGGQGATDTAAQARADARARVQAAQAVADAERSLQRARLDGLRQVQDAEVAYERARHDGVQAVIQAEQRLMQVIQDNARQRQQLQQSLSDAQASLAGERARGGANVALAQAGVTQAQADLGGFNQTAAQSEKAARQDVAQAQLEAYRQISDAEKALRKARLDDIRSVSDAERNLQRQRQQQADTAAKQAGASAAQAVDAVAQAYNKLTPLQQQVADQILQIKNRWAELTAGARNRFLQELLFDLEAVNRRLPELATDVSRFSDAIVGGMRNLRAQFDDAGFRAVLDRLSTAIAGDMGLVIDGLIQTGKSFVYVADAARPFTHWLAELISQWGHYFDNTAKADDANGSIARFLVRTRTSLTLVGNIIRDTTKAIANIFNLSWPQGRGLLQTLADYAKQFRNFTESPGGKNDIREFFQNTIKIWHALAALLESLTTGFFGLISNATKMNGPLTLFINLLNSLLQLPVAGQLTAWGVQFAILAKYVPGLQSAVKILAQAIFLELIPALIGVDIAGAPILLIIAVIGLLVLAGVALWQNWFGIRDKLASVWHTIERVAKTVFSAITDFISGHWKDMVIFLIGGPVGIVYLLARWTGVWGTIRDVAANVWDSITKHAKNWWNDLTGAFNFDNLKRGFALGWWGIKNITQNNLNGLLDIFYGVNNKIIDGINFVLRHIGLGGDTLPKPPEPHLNFAGPPPGGGGGGGGGGRSGARATSLLPAFEKGGVVPGPPGSPQVILAHGGEVVVPRGLPGGGIISDVGGAVTGAISSIAGDTFDFLASIAGDVGGFVGNHLPSIPDMGKWGTYGKMAAGALKHILGKAKNWLVDKVGSVIPDFGFGGGGGGVTLPRGLGESKLADRAVAFAVSQLGVPYLWGGEMPALGFDCSGLIDWAYAQAGLGSVPRTSQEQAGAGYARVQPGDWVPGDLIFSNFPGETFSPGHVVMYVGNGKVIAAPHTGANVEFEDVGLFLGSVYRGSVRPWPARTKRHYATGGVIGEDEGWLHRMGSLVPIMAHVGEWVVNGEQQMRLAAALGGLSRAREYLFQGRTPVAQRTFASGGIVTATTPRPLPSEGPQKIVEQNIAIQTSSPMVDVDYVARILEQRMAGV